MVRLATCKRADAKRSRFAAGWVLQNVHTAHFLVLVLYCGQAGRRLRTAGPGAV